MPALELPQITGAAGLTLLSEIHVKNDSLENIDIQAGVEGKAAWKNVLIILFLCGTLFIVLSVIALKLDAFDWFYDFSRAHEDWELDELALVILSAVLSALLAASLITYQMVQRLQRANRKNRESLDQIVLANEKLRTTRHRQDQLFSIISHELRTPAATIAMLLEQSEGRDIDMTNSAQLKKSAAQLLSVLADMRQVVNPQENMPVESRPYDVAELFQDVVSLLKPLAIQQAMTIAVSCEALDDCPKLTGDLTRLHMIVVNLIKNALVHSGGTIVNVAVNVSDIESQSTSKLLTITVTDDGRGIPKDLQSHMFEAFMRGEQKRNLVDSTGLGLFIVKQSVDVLGGKISHRSDPATGGASFAVSLVQGVAPEQHDEQVRATANIDLTGKRVLLAEDTAPIRMLTAKLLEQFGCEVVSVENGEQAWRHIENGEHFDLVLTDLFMPQMDGAELTAKLRQRFADLPIVGVTAAVLGDDADQFHQQGVSMVLPKPITRPVLQQLLNQLFGAGQNLI